MAFLDSRNDSNLLLSSPDEIGSHLDFLIFIWYVAFFSGTIFDLFGNALGGEDKSVEDEEIEWREMSSGDFERGIEFCGFGRFLVVSGFIIRGPYKSWLGLTSSAGSFVPSLSL